VLEEIIEKVQNNGNKEGQIYKEYNNLFIHCLKCNLNMVITLWIMMT